MHVNKTKKIAILGVFAALSTVFTVLGTVISVNTVFFTYIFTSKSIKARTLSKASAIVE